MTGARVHVVEILGDAGLRAAHDIAELLRKALAAHDKVAVATEAITSADITTIQLLLAARKQAEASGKSLSLAAPAAGALRELLLQVGCLDAGSRGPGSDGEFWTRAHSEGKAA